MARTRLKDRPADDFMRMVTKMQAKLPGAANEAGRITGRWMEEYAKSHASFNDTWKYQQSSPGPLRLSIRGKLTVAAKRNNMVASVDIAAGFKKYKWVYKGTRKAHYTSDYARRIEMGFHGTDSLGRNYSQEAIPYLEPTAKVADNLGIWAKNLRWQIALRMR